MVLEDKMNKKIIDCFQILETVLPKMHQIVQIYAVPGEQEVDINMGPFQLGDQYLTRAAGLKGLLPFCSM